MKKAITLLFALTLATSLFATSAIVYFSATGNTESVANTLSDLTGAEVFEIVPAVPYAEDDLNYREDNSRANNEQNDPFSRPEISGSFDLSSYDTVYVGFPIWWGRLPKIMYTFFETYDFSGKTVAPFCTSGGSGIGTAVNEIRELEPNANVIDGLRTSRRNAERDLSSYLEENNLN